MGFRPFVFRIAAALGIAGWVRNRSGQVEVHAEGVAGRLDRFASALLQEAPTIAAPEIVSIDDVPVEDWSGFHIQASAADARVRIHVPPDYFTCPECLAELTDPADRRYRYPFINCTQCGPRYTLIRALPYDRINTTMAGFPLCAACEREYTAPLDRRFHAEPIACPTCGPRLTFRDGQREIVGNEPALAACITALSLGRIVAVKGIGGYHLMCDAHADAPIRRLRERKPRPHKPLALLCPERGAGGLDAVHLLATPTGTMTDMLRAPSRPIVLLPKRAQAPLSELIAPGMGEVGVMLPYSPLHHLLLRGYDRPLVATSANISGEPVLTDPMEVEARLGRVADAFLHHDRPIQRPADDPVFRPIQGRPRPIRLGRGCAPLELDLPFVLAEPILAVGAHMKNTIALGWENRAVISPHIGDMGSLRSQAVFEQVVADLQALYQVEARRVTCDAHPDYATSRWARRSGLPVTPIFHHHAHASALAAEHDGERWLMFTWDGIGFGEDGTLWGGEAFLGRPGAWRRIATVRPFRLPGGERASREPWRSAAAICWETGTDWVGVPDPDGLARGAWERELNAPITSAVGRLFDAAAALLDIRLHASFEGQGPMELETIAGPVEHAGPPLPVQPRGDGLLQIDWGPLVPFLGDRSRSIAERAAGFHDALANAIVEVAERVTEHSVFDHVGLTGGVFQNRLLTERASTLLSARGFGVRLAEQVPCNDAAISFGQVIEYAARVGEAARSSTGS